MTRVVTVIGARSQFIKAATVSRALGQSDVREILVHTGQYYDANMSDVLFDEVQISRPHQNLEIGVGSRGQMTGASWRGSNWCCSQSGRTDCWTMARTIPHWPAFWRSANMRISIVQAEVLYGNSIAGSEKIDDLANAVPHCGF